jgi:hypothetical protein
MEGSQGFQRGMSFGGINVILCGDLHQFPPVACRKQEPLYYPTSADDPTALQVGRKIYEEFSKVVILGEQVRVTDHVWRDFLDHLRHGRVEPRHLKMLRTLLLKRQTKLFARTLFKYNLLPQPTVWVTVPWHRKIEDFRRRVPIAEFRSASDPTQRSGS